MGIPSYFTKLIKKHGRVIKPIQELPPATHFYLDSNSIIYDCLRDLQNVASDTNNLNLNHTKFEHELCTSVCKKITEYITIVNATKHLTNVVIAFDGVAPVAKLCQQRSRRHRSQIVQSIISAYKSDKNSQTRLNDACKWDKTAITPGTKFMANLAKHTRHHFHNTIEFPKCKIIISASDEPGEGEHKIFDFIRKNENGNSGDSHVIYGLDADLIMLCLNNSALLGENGGKFYLFRETPEFIRSVDKSLKPNENYYLDIEELADEIMDHMNYDISLNRRPQIIHDYILICFMLGNDFLPHFPSINIRTNGIDVLVNTYMEHIASKEKCLTYFNDDRVINIRWNALRDFIGALSSKEYELLMDTYQIRNKKASFYRNWRRQELDDFGEKNLDMIPYVFRDTEQYINPHHSGWERRYYETLFHANYNTKLINQIGENYLEGLEWVLKYYTHECTDWTWEYKYHYPPLLKDLLTAVPFFDEVKITASEASTGPIHPLTQLSYVIPKTAWHLLPKKIVTMLDHEYRDVFGQEVDFEWAFCSKFWEAHLVLPHIDLDHLGKNIAIQMR